MKLINFIVATAVLIPAVGYAQTTAPRITSLSKLDPNNDKKITKEEALKAGMPQAVFIKIDKDKNGEISITELDVYRSQNNSIAPLDNDKDQKISKAEAIKAGMTEQEFTILDKDNNGYITQAEWDSGYWIIW